MNRLVTTAMFFVFTLPLLVPATGTAAQSGDPCADALNGIAPAGYEIVWGSGGSGRQVVLGTDGADWLDGGDDTLVGMDGDVFDGGSGRNEIVANTPVSPYDPGPFTPLFEPAGDGGCTMYLQVTGGAPNTLHQPAPYYADTLEPIGGAFFLTTDADGAGTSGPWAVPMPQGTRLLLQFDFDFYGIWTVAC